MAAGERRRSAQASLEEISHLIEGALERSAADETEVVWLEIARGRVEAKGGRSSGPPPASPGRRAGDPLTPERTILVRVLDHGRVGSYRTGWGEPGELDNAIRQAMAQSRVREPVAGLPHLPAEAGEASELPRLRDPKLSELTPQGALSLLTQSLRKNESADLFWAEALVAVLNSRSVRRKAVVTAAQLSVSAGTATATSAARHLDELEIEATCERARSRAGSGERAPLPDEPFQLVLSQEATISLVDLLNEAAFSAKAYYDGTSFLREHLGVQVFDRSLHLRDDGTDPAGLPFPFDLEGTLKHPVDLIRDGIPRTPALDQRQAAVLGLAPTAHAIGGNNARAEHLFLETGDLTEEELLEAGEGGLWVSTLSGIETLDPQRLRFQATVRGARRIEGGKLGRPVGAFRWEDSLLRAFADLEGRGRQAHRRLGPDGFFGGISAPGLVIRGAELSPAG
jgi:predicted Zn-dependent protease